MIFLLVALIKLSAIQGLGAPRDASDALLRPLGTLGKLGKAFGGPLGPLLGASWGFWGCWGALGVLGRVLGGPWGVPGEALGGQSAPNAMPVDVLAWVRPAEISATQR